MKLRHRPVAVFTDLGRARVGEMTRPLASGVHISKRLTLGAFGFTTSYKGGREDQSRPSHPTEERTLDGLDAA